MRLFLSACLFLCVIQLTKAADGGSDSGSATASSAVVSGNYKLQPSDLIKVQVYQEDDLTREVRVSQDSTITLPLIGTVDVRGLSVQQAETLIQNLYGKDYLVNPSVTIVIKEFAPRTVDVEGQVGKPGAIDFPQEQGMTLIGAITRAGGFTRLADKTKVMLTRRMPDGQLKTFKIDATDIIEGKTQDLWPLQIDDSIYVPERIL